jgi:hypothetical protein
MAGDGADEGAPGSSTRCTSSTSPTRRSVSESWRDFFADYQRDARRRGQRPRQGAARHGPHRRHRPDAGGGTVGAPPAPPAAPTPSRHRHRRRRHRRGARRAAARRAARIVENMEAASRCRRPPRSARCRPSCSRSTAGSSTATWGAPGGQGQLHPPDRLRHRPAMRPCRHEQHLPRRSRRQARLVRNEQRRAGPRVDVEKSRRHPHAARAGHQGRRHDRLRAASGAPTRT